MVAETAGRRILAKAVLTQRGEGVILLIEDNALIRLLVLRVLAERGYAVHTASNGRVALEKLVELKSIDLIISDVVLPDARRPELLQDVLRNRPGLPVLFISGYDGGTLQSMQFSGTRVDYLPKPFSRTTLLEKVAVMLQ